MTENDGAITRTAETAEKGLRAFWRELKGLAQQAGRVLDTLRGLRETLVAAAAALGTNADRLPDLWQALVQAALGGG